ncbi:MAG: transporter [Bacteroidales bacterium]|nr:transporter [Bacteroidales bacterium]
MKKIFLLFLMLFAFYYDALAQYGRIYVNVPCNDNYFQVHYYNSISNSWAEQSIPADKNRSITTTGSLSYTRVMNIFGRTGGPGIVIPYTNMLSYNEEFDTITYRQHGFGDPSLTFDCNIFGAPSLRKNQYDEHIPTNYMSAHYVMSFPFGNYNVGKTTNIGANRYTYKFVLNYAITTMKGKNWIDMYASVKLSSKNTDYLGQYTLSQKPIYGFEFHYSQDVLGKLLGPHFWFDLGFIYSGGGRVIVGDNTGHDQNSLKACGSLSFPTWKHGSIIIGYNGTVWCTEGASKTYQLVIQINCPFIVKSEM